MTALAVASEGADVRLASGLSAAVRGVAESARGAGEWSSAERGALIREVDRAVAVLTSVRADLLVAERRSGEWRRSGDRSFEAWRGRTSRTGMRAASTEVRRADALVRMPDLRQATENGQVSVEHVDVLAKAAADGSASVRDALASPQGQAELLGLARRMDAGTFAKSVALWAATLDSQALERNHQAQRAARFLHLTDTPVGTKINGRLDRMTGHRLRLALEAVSGRPAADDDRAADQRRADALSTMAEKMLALPETGSGAAVRPHVSVLMSVEAWAALRAAQSDRGGEAGQVGQAGRAAVGGEAGQVGQVGRRECDGAPPATLEDGTPVPPSELARILCDCELTRLVLDSADEPVNLGRAARTYTGAQRRAVIARDGGCIWPSCDMHARWCEVHHVEWWDRDVGDTSVGNGALLCSFHHHQVHTLDLTITRHPIDPAESSYGTRRVRYTFTRPDGSVIAGAPPGEEPAGVPRCGESDGAPRYGEPERVLRSGGSGGARSARPVRRHQTSSRLNAPRPWM